MNMAVIKSFVLSCALCLPLVIGMSSIPDRPPGVELFFCVFAIPFWTYCSYGLFN
jgi:hypothetical protein